MNRQAVENETPTNIVEPGQSINDQYGIFSYLGEVYDLHGFQYG